jgi:hypothetical protein
MRLRAHGTHTASASHGIGHGIRHRSRHALPHLVMSPRAEGPESEVVRRLTQDIEPEGVRRVLVRCLGGELPAADALIALLAESGDADVVRQAVDEVTRRADEDSRADDRMVRDRVDDLTKLIVDPEDGADRMADRVAPGRAPRMPDPGFTAAEHHQPPPGPAGFSA